MPRQMNTRAGDGRGGGSAGPLWLAAGALAALLLAWQAHQIDFLIDDAFIPLRYAANWLAGHGPVFNPGERVEGYTDFSWVLAGAAALAAGFEPLGFYRFLGLLAGGALVVAAPWFSRRLGGDKPAWLAALAAPALALSTPIAVWSYAGMETSLFALLAVSGVVLAVSPPRRPRAATALLVLACFTRPEGHLFLGAVLLALVLPRATRREGLACSAAAASVLAPYHLWRLLYYGSLLPNTFTAKVGSGADQLWRGAGYLRDFAAAGPGLLLLLVAWPVAARWRELRIALPAAVTAAWLGYVVLVGGDSMHGFRFLVPVLPLATLLFVEALELARAALARRGLPRAGGALAAALALAFGGSQLWVGRAAFVEEARRQTEAVRRWEAVGRWMKESLPPTTHLALGAVGAIPYASGFRTTDIFGLTDPVIARTETPGMGTGLAGHERANAARVLERRPDLILSYVVLTDRPLTLEGARHLYDGSPAERALWASPGLWEAYELAELRVGEGYLNVLARKGWPGPLRAP